MREIKFRGKINKLPKCSDGYPYKVGNWIYGFYVKAKRIEDGKIKIYHYIYTEGTVVGSVDPETVGQFIDSHDKNGKEIYEGDILIIKDPQPSNFSRKRPTTSNIICDDFVVRNFIEDSYTLKQQLQKEIEIIGNIYENPELLKEKR